MFEKLDYEVWQEFEPYHKLPQLTMNNYEKHLAKKSTENFYQLMKIQAPQVLNY